VQLKGKEEFKELLLIANRILVTLGVGYFHQVYRHAFYYELKIAQIDFEMIEGITATYHDKTLKSKEIGFFRIGNLLLSVVAVKALNQLTLSKFSHFVRYFNCQRGLIFNFNAMYVDFRYLER
jgi:GxxExxY protein